VKIVFSDGSGPKQTLYYFSTNLADGSVDRSGFSVFLAKLGPADSLIKSASYLLDNSHFASVRKLLLDRSATILQDDSGIPLAYFEPKKWRLQAFGHYAGPISIFANFYQPQMAALFQGANPIEFGIGYRWRKNESNLLLAHKEPSPNSDAELTPHSQAEGNAAGAAAPSPKKTRKRAWKPKRRGRQAAETRESSRSVGKSKLAGMPQNEDIVVEPDFVGCGVRYGRGTNIARCLQASHVRGAAYGCALFCSGHNISAAA
jgi:hypothetical protein